MHRLLRPGEVSPGGLVLLLLSAFFIAVAGFEHARLFHRGYGGVELVGPLFLLNGIASAVVVLLLAVRRYALYVIGAVGISVGSLVSILISHSSGFFGFRESGYDGDAKVIVVAEAIATVLALAGALAGLRSSARAVAA